MVSYYGTIKILILGEASVGKNSFIKRYCYNLFNPSERLTIGVDFHIKTIKLNEKLLKLQLWDVGGEERYRFLLPTYCLGANAAFLLYDVTRSQTLDNIGEWVNIVHQKSGDIPIMLVGILPDKKNDREVAEEEGKKMANSMKLSGYVECNIQTGENVDEAFEILTRLILIQPQFCHKCQKEFTFEEFLNHPCYKTGDVLSTGVEKGEFLNRDLLRKRWDDQKKGQEFLKETLKLIEYSLKSREFNQNSAIAFEVLVKMLSLYYEKYSKEFKKFLESIKKLEDYDENKYPYSEILLLFYGDDQYRNDFLMDMRKRRIEGGDRYPFPYVFKPPEPPDDLALAPRAQLHHPPKKKDIEEKIHCQYCGMELTKEEQINHSCKEKPKNT